MTISALTQQPRLADATPLALVRADGSPQDFARVLGVSLDAAQLVGDQILSARIEVPPGEWLLWPERGWALWIGAGADALPSTVRRYLADGTAEDLIELIDALATAGVWCRDAALLTGDGWTRPRRADAVFAVLSARRATALRGVFVDRSGRAARLEIASGRVCWTDRPGLAVQWLLNAVDLPLPT
jgi:hypothetical protein